MPPTDSDEATMGLAALHVIQGRDVPIYMYGQHYMGVLEAYLAVPFVALLGTTTLALRIPELLLYAAFLPLMYRLVTRLYSPWFATFSVGLLAIGSDRVLKDQLIAHGRTAEIKPVAAALLLIAISLASERSRRRTLACLGWGLIAGLMLWVDWLIVPYLATALTVLLIRDRTGRARLGRDWLWLAAGLLAGAVPLIAYNVTAAPGEGSLTVFWHLNQGPSTSLAARLFGGVMLGVPLSTGVCHPSHCTAAERLWGPAFLLLLVLAGSQALIAVRRHRVPTRQWGRLALVTAALFSVAAYSRGSAAAISPIESARYLSCVLVSLPAALWPLWAAARQLVATRRSGSPSGAGPRGLTGTVLALLPLVAFAALSLDAAGALVTRKDAIAAAATRQAALIRSLEATGAPHLYADYWTCNRLAYATRERIACAVLEPTMESGQDKYPPLAAIVHADPHPVYAFPARSVTDNAFVDYLRGNGIQYAVSDVAGYHVYRVPAGAGVPLRRSRSMLVRRP
ncbi:ArnT family glycosyltransferase [Rugosimonospora acidiphila]|uniref:ArnT family glycosyltransferase n=1 Tax=Rugosimonospora acidiphila TaxID=556531 RepID=UPI0031E880E3